MIVFLLCLLLAVPVSAAEPEYNCTAKVEQYVNIRKEPSSESDPIGKLYRGGVGTVLKEVETDDGLWYRIRSGPVIGYVSSQYLYTGEEAMPIIEDAAYTVAQVIPAELTVFDEPDSGSNMIDVVHESAFLDVLEEQDGWTKIVSPYQITGWVPSDQLTKKEVYSLAETLKQEEERLEQESNADETAKTESDLWQVAEEALQGTEPSRLAVMDALMAQEEARSTFLEAGGTDQEAQLIEEEILETEEDTEETGTEQLSEELTEENTEEMTEDVTEEVLPDYVLSYRSSVEKVRKAQEAAEAEQAKAHEKVDAAQKASITAAAAEKVAIEAARKAPRGAEGCEFTTKRDHTIYFPPSIGDELVSYAAQFVGNPYVWGGESLTNGCDCSGFTMLVYAKYGITLPHFAQSQAAYGTPVDKEDLQPGDLVFFERNNYIFHVAIYIGNDTVIHAASRASGICFSRLGYSSAHQLYRRLL